MTPNLTREEKEKEKNRLLFTRGGWNGSDYRQDNASRYERILKRIFFHASVWVTVKGKRRLGVVQPTHMKFVGWHPISGDPIFEVDVKGVDSGRIVRMNSRTYNLELDIESEAPVTTERIE